MNDINRGANYKEQSYCHSIKDVEKFGAEGDQYAIVEFTSVSIPGDERSRTNPGHGYPAHTQQVCEFTTYVSKEAWEKEIRYRLHQKSYREWFPIVFRCPTIETTISVNIDSEHAYREAWKYD